MAQEGDVLIQLTLTKRFRKRYRDVRVRQASGPKSQWR